MSKGLRLSSLRSQLDRDAHACTVTFRAHAYVVSCPERPPVRPAGRRYVRIGTRTVRARVWRLGTRLFRAGIHCRQKDHSLCHKHNTQLAPLRERSLETSVLTIKTSPSCLPSHTSQYSASPWSVLLGRTEQENN